MTDLKTFLFMLVKADKEYNKTVIESYNTKQAKEIIVWTDEVFVVFDAEGNYLRIDL